MSSTATSTVCGKKRQNHILSRKSLLKFLPRLSHTRSSTHLAHSKPHRQRQNSKYVASKIRQPYVSRWTAVVLYPKRSLYDPETADISNLDYKQKTFLSISHLHPFLPNMRYSKLIKSSEQFLPTVKYLLHRWDTEDCKGKKSWYSLSVDKDMPLVFQYFFQVVETKQKKIPSNVVRRETLELCQH